MLNKKPLFLAVLLTAVFTLPLGGQEKAQWIKMPARGICAHRGASDTHPENTLAALREAIRLGAQMIEFDVAFSKDRKLVLMHDQTVDRTTNGTGPVSQLTLAELKQLDAGSWKGRRFAGERIPTFDEALAVMPDNIWLNVHLKGPAELAEQVTRTLIAHERLHQAFLACGTAAARAAKRVDPTTRICNMERQANSQRYVDETIDMRVAFIQLLGGQTVDPAHIRRLKRHGIRINYCCANDATRVDALLKSGVEFPLVDRVAEMLTAADRHGIRRLEPVYRSRLKLPGLARLPARLLQQHKLEEGAANQGLALTKEHYFTSTASSIFRYDHQWKLLQEKPIRIDGVNHVGAIDHHEGFLWAGLLRGPENGQHDPALDRAIIAKIRASDLAVVETWDISDDVTWIDPVCFDGEYLWVGDLSDLGIHRYRFDGGRLERDGVFRYPAAMHFSQGIRVVGQKLYTIHTFGSLDGLFEFELPAELSETPQQPARVWQIAESRMHLEGFDFIPGQPNQIWHAQGGQVDRYQLETIPLAASVAPAAPITHGPFVGHVASNEAQLWIRCSVHGEYQLVARDSQGHQVTATSSARPDQDGCVNWRLAELKPNTRYHYQIQRGEEILAGGDDYFFDTSGPADQTVRLAFGSCAREDQGSAAVWREMHAADPHAVVLLGDTPYIDSTDLDVQRKRHAEFAAVPEFRRLLRSCPLYATWDDHDFGRNDTDGNLPGKENSRRAFVEYRPNPSHGSGRQGIYTKFRRGAVEVFLLDTRYFAGTERSPFAPQLPSLLGQQQWEWLSRELQASTAPFKLLACGMIWNSAVRPGKRDHWATYPHERQALFDLIGRHHISGVILVGGDVHRTRVLRHQTADNAGYQIPELVTSPIHDGVIETANAPHPALVYDAGRPNTFLLIAAVESAQSSELIAKFQDSNGEVFFETRFNARELQQLPRP